MTEAELKRIKDERKAELNRIVERAMELIEPPAEKRGAIKRDIEQAVRFGRGFIKRAETYKQYDRYGKYGILAGDQKYGVLTGDQKYGVLTGDQKEAAGKLEVALDRLRAAVAEAAAAKYLLVGFPLDEDEIDHWQKRVKADAETQLPPPIRRDTDKNVAAKLAGQLLRKHGLPLMVGRSSKFCRLAALFYGDEAAYLRRQCTAYRRVAGAK